MFGLNLAAREADPLAVLAAMRAQTPGLAGFRLFHDHDARVIAQVPGSMLFLGALVEGPDPANAPSNHSPRAAFDDSVLPKGAALYAALAANHRPTAPPS